MNTKADSKRGSVSLAQVIWDKAAECMARKGFNGNFSAYVADLIRQDAAQRETNPPRKNKSSPRLP